MLKESENAKTLDSEKIIHDAVVSTINSATSLLNVVTAELLRTEKQHSTVSIGKDNHCS